MSTDSVALAWDRARSVGRVVGLVIQYSLLAVLLPVWLVVGFIFWVPLIVRATAAFFVTAVHTNLVSRAEGVPNGGLQHAAFFYVNGFRSIYRAVVELQSDEPQTTPAFRLDRFFAESLWTILFWWITPLTLAYLGVGFTSYLDQLVYPVAWLIEEAQATWAWLLLAFDSLLASAGF